MKFVATHEFDTTDPVLEGKRLREVLTETKVVHCRPGRDLGDLRSFYDLLVEQVGTPDEIGEDFTRGGERTGERWLEIRYDADVPDMAAFRHSKNAQPLHTDESYVSEFSDVMLFYCVNQATSGGATVFVDGPALESRLQAVDPDLHRDLSSIPVTYSKADDCRKELIIGTDTEGRTKFNFNYFCIDPDATAEERRLNQAFFEFVESESQRGELVHRVNLAPGESVAWWDHLVLHGREAFEAHETNDRFIWKCGVRWDSDI